MALPSLLIGHAETARWHYPPKGVLFDRALHAAKCTRTLGRPSQTVWRGRRGHVVTHRSSSRLRDRQNDRAEIVPTMKKITIVIALASPKSWPFPDAIESLYV